MTTAETLCDRVCVCGGRRYGDMDEVVRILHQLHPKLIIHGGASGADTLADVYAETFRIPKEVYMPNRTLDGTGRDWKFRRNSRMLANGRPTLVVAFAGGPGTADTVKKARAAGIPTIEVDDRRGPGEYDQHGMQ